jgi:hypothetical protein
VANNPKLRQLCEVVSIDKFNLIAEIKSKKDLKAEGAMQP